MGVATRATEVDTVVRETFAKDIRRCDWRGKENDFANRLPTCSWSRDAPATDACSWRSAPVSASISISIARWWYQPSTTLVQHSLRMRSR